MSSLGDIIHTIPFVNILHNKLSDKAQIDWVVNNEYLSLIKNNGIIRNAIGFDRKQWLSPIGFIKTFKEIKNFSNMLKSERYDLVLDLQGLLKSALVATIAAGKKTIGFSDAREGATIFYDIKINAPSDIHALEKNLFFLDYFNLKWQIDEIDFPIYVSDDDASYINKQLETFNIADKKFAVFCPFSRWQTKMWDENNFHMLENLLVANGINIIWTGSKNEKLTKDVSYNLIGKLSLNQLYYLFKKCLFVVTCDSGAMHLASAAGSNVFTIFGPTSPKKTGPYNVKGSSVIIRKDGLSCSPCFKRHCDIGNVCLDISANEVFKKIKETLPL